MLPLRVQEIGSIDELKQLRGQWSDLWERCPDAAPFHAPEWLLPWWSHLFGGGEMWALAVWRCDRLVGLAPMFIYGYEHEPRTVASIGSGVTDYLGFLLEDAGALDIIWSHVTEHRSRWDIFDLQEICATSPLLQFRISGAWQKETCPSGVCPVVELPSTMEEFETGLAPKFRHNLRNARNRLRNLGEITFDTAAPGQHREYLEALFRLHSARWEARNEAGMFSTAPLKAFYGEVAEEFQRRGWLRLHGLRFQGQLVGVIYLFLTRRRAYSYLGGFDDSLERHSPGTALIGYAIEQAIREGAVEFDFLRKREEYKYRWGAVDRANSRLLIRPITPA